jgi:small subunit ribosomal protein S3
MSTVKRIIEDSLERVEVDEFLAEEYEQAGYGGITLTKTPLGSQINLFAMRPGRVIGKRGRAIKAASAKLEEELGLSNPQITVIEVEVPELNPMIMASRVANALERGVHFRRAVFWSLNRIMDSGAIGCEIILKGPLRSARSRFEKVVEGYVPKSGDPALRYVKTATIHVKMKRGVLGVTVNIVSPDARFPDKVDLSELPEIQVKPPVEEAETEVIEKEETEVMEEEKEEKSEAPTSEEPEEEEPPKAEEAKAEEETSEEETKADEKETEEQIPEPESERKTEAEKVLETPEDADEDSGEEKEPETQIEEEPTETDTVPSESEDKPELKSVSKEDVQIDKIEEQPESEEEE